MRKWLGTLITRKWFLSSISSSMHLKRNSLGKLFRILITKTGFSPVWFLYASSKEQLEEKLGTLITMKRFHSSMSSSMILQITCYSKWHQSQGNGFSPVFVLLWVFKFLTSERDFGHTLPGKDFHKSFEENCEILLCLLIKTFENYRKKKLINLKIIWIRISTYEIDRNVFFLQIFDF